jgi:hypothetical protein
MLYAEGFGHAPSLILLLLCVGAFSLDFLRDSPLSGGPSFTITSAALRISLPQLSTHSFSVEEDSLLPSPRVITSASPAPASSAVPTQARETGLRPRASTGDPAVRTQGI